MRERRHPWVAPLLLGAVCLVAAAQACVQPEPTSPRAGAGAGPTLRLVVVSNVAGAIEPCGCTPDQLGGLDHLGALLASAQPRAEATALLSVGSMLFGPPPRDEARPEQDRWKAETIALGAAQLGLSAWAPGPGDLGEGADAVRELGRLTSSPLLGTAVAGTPLVPSALLELGRVRVGVIGITEPPAAERRSSEQGPAAGPSTDGPSAAPERAEASLAAVVRREAEKLASERAELLVLLAAVPRGEALRVAEAVPSLHVVAVGEPSGAGVADDEPVVPELVGQTLVVQSANHLQNAAIVDIYLEADHRPQAGPLVLADLGDLGRAKRAAALSRRIRQLELRINDWTRSGLVAPTEIAARRADLERLRTERATLETAVGDQAAVSGFRFSAREVRAELGVDAAVAELLGRYYRRVNDHNRVAYADRLPPPVPEGQAGYVGVKACTAECHQLARQFWESRPHARAYVTLQKDAKEFNLECVGCHVTGYERPGGSTVTHNELLQGVQCEECHGPGSLHQVDSEAPGLIVRKTDPSLCVERCHHPPHVSDFDPVEKMPLMLGPGHGAP